MLPNERTTRNQAAAAPGEIEALVVSPDRHSAKPLTDFLRTEGANIQVACSVDTAIEEALLHRPHIILIDENISPACGIDLCSRLKSNTRTHFLPAILWTQQKGNETVRLDALSAGADAVFTPSTTKEEKRLRLWALLRSNSLYRKMDRKRQDLNQMIRDKRQWVRELIHDIQNSLGAIQANFEYLAQTQDEHNHQSDLDECVHDTRSSFRGLVRSLRTVLEFERFEAGDVVLRENPILLSELVEAVASSLEDDLSSSTKKIVVKAQSCSQPVTGDPNYLKEAFSNLITFIIRQSDNRVCTIALTDEGSHCRIEVSGDRFRIPTEAQQRLFSPYNSRKKNNYQMIGYGVGLALSKVIIELHKGFIEVIDLPSAGSAFIVEIPSLWPSTNHHSSE
jgi:K+-sensing histidine kinase KdpD